MILTEEQESAMDKIFRWIERGDWMFYLGGYAGTGKTTLLQEVINRLPDSPLCLAPTGKAASVLQSKLTNAVVSTVHSALYKPIPPDARELERLERELAAKPGTQVLMDAIHEEKKKLAKKGVQFTDNLVKDIQPGDLVFVDEASMVTNKMVQDFRLTGAKVMFVGDPGQLPPVKESGYFLKHEPNAMLSHIQRQALDNPIIELSMKIREGGSIPTVIDSPQLVRRCKSGFTMKALAEADQVLTGMNAVRRRVNRGIRKFKGFDSVFPEAGEKLICLKNEYRGARMTNGIQCLSASAANVNITGDRIMSVLYEGRIVHDVKFYHYPFEAHYNPNAEEDIWNARKDLSELDYGYAITVHKAQGSEWNRVVLVDDGIFTGTRDRKRWLYTAVTRAKEHLTWLTNS